MNRLRCVLFATVVISSSTLALGGEIQFPGKSNPAPTPTPSALTTTTSHDLTQSTSTEEFHITWQDDTMMLLQLLLTIF
jgi:hypothetical protein